MCSIRHRGSGDCRRREEVRGGARLSVKRFGMEEKMEQQMDFEKKQRAAVRRGRIGKALTYFFLSVWALIVLFPFYWMLLTSVKSYSSYNAEHVPTFFTLSPTLQNYKDAFTTVPLLGVSDQHGDLHPGDHGADGSGQHACGLRLRAPAFSGERIFCSRSFLSLMMIPNELVGHHKFCHHHQPGSAQYLHRADPAVCHLGLLYLPAERKF